MHKADLQPESGQSPDHVAIDETGIRLNDEQCWLYAGIDPETNELLDTKLEPTTKRWSLVHSLSNSARNTTLTTLWFSSTARTHRKTPVQDTVTISDTNAT